MKKIILLSLILSSLFLILPHSSYAIIFPTPTGFVNDFANILSPDVKTSLEQKLVSFEKEKSIEFSVVTIPSLQGTTIEDYAVKLFENWKIGKPASPGSAGLGGDNGLLFLIAPNEKKVRFEVGYGLEGTLPDAKTGRILDDYVIPNFKNNDYAKGVEQGTNAALAILSGEPSPTLPNPPKSSNLPIPGEFIFFLVIIVVQYLASFLARSKSFWAGGVLGAIAGVIIGLISHIILIGLLSAIGLAVLGLILDYFLSKNYGKLKGLGKSTSFWTTFGGFGGGSRGGGFGGFGGGSSGGGGSSRGW